MKRRLLATFLSLCLLVGLLPTVALAAEDGTKDNPWDLSVENNGSVTAYLTQDESTGYTLHIEGNGAIAPEKRYEEYGNKKSQITKIEIGAGITSIGKGAFWECTQAEEIIFDSGSQLEEIGMNAFHSNSSLKSITFPESLSTIGNAAFYGCSALESVNFLNPDNMKVIGNSAFAACTSLKYFNNPE